MIIVDFSQTCISNLMVTLGKNFGDGEIEVDLLRHFILNSIRGYKTKFGAEYGELVLACDDRYSWRKDYYPYYKANRKKSREESKLDWNSIFKGLEQIRDELKETFSYRVLHVTKAEGDDIIATLCHKFGSVLNTGEKLLILSGDKDMVQLQVYANVVQYDPVQNKWRREPNPARFLKEQIIRGDGGDGVPNVLSPDDCLVVGTRQKSISFKKLELWLSQDPTEYPEALLRGFKRNEQMIDLSKIPTNIQNDILAEFDQQAGKTHKNLLQYFMEHRLRNLTEKLYEF